MTESIIEWAIEIKEQWPQSKEIADKLIALIDSKRWDVHELVALYIKLKEYDKPNGVY
jgi:threonine dehydrogenase-like Zn-dependent dehydrogenase